jgi:hypothetical protein
MAMERAMAAQAAVSMMTAALKAVAKAATTG